MEAGQVDEFVAQGGIRGRDLFSPTGEYDMACDGQEI